MSRDDDHENLIDPIAIIGMSCRFPGASTVREFWSNLKNGKEGVSFFPDEELIQSGVEKAFFSLPGYVKASCVVDDIDMFDFAFFGYSREEAELIDPQQRLFLECAYEALEESGYAHSQQRDVGVFGGVRTSGYARVLQSVLRRPGSAKSFDALLGTAVDQACLRISYSLGLEGPSIGIQTACSASVVATHMACESIRSGECSMALAGASSLNIPQQQGYLYNEQLITSPDGHCRAFDAGANGAVGGNGVGVVLLKRLEDALRDKDPLYAVIRGSAVNNDGARKAGYRVPSAEGQRHVIEEALMISGVGPEQITYVEGNGTGTLIGDSIEIEALSHVFQGLSTKEMRCGLGSVKTNIGHLTQGAGIAALIKTALCLKNKALVPSLNYETPNPSLAGSPFFVVDRLMDWRVSGDARRLAGINSFAVGGTNAHMILEEPPALPDVSDTPQNAQVLTLSAKTPASLEKARAAYIDFLADGPAESLEDICFTSCTGRFHYPERLAVVASSIPELRHTLEAKELIGVGAGSKHAFSHGAGNAGNGLCVFGHPGSLGGNHRFLYENQPHFKDAVDGFDDLLNAYDMPGLSSFFSGYGKARMDEAHGLVYAFCLQYALYRMLSRFGVCPQAVCGHGAGILAAACAAGVFQKEEGVNVAHHVGNVVSASPEERQGCVLSLNKALGALQPKGASIVLYWGGDGRMVETQHVRDPDFWVEACRETEEDGFDFSRLHRVGPFDFTVHVGAPSSGRDRRNGVPSLSLGAFDRAEWEHTLSFFCDCYERGMDIRWGSLMKGSRGRRVFLPTYCFNKTSCWYTE